MNGQGSAGGHKLAKAGTGLLVLGMVALGSGPLIGQAQEGYSAEEIQIARHDAEQFWPRISGKYVVWQDFRNLPAGTVVTGVNADILGRNIDNGDDFKVTDNHTSARPAISGSRVVYTDSRKSNDSGLDIRGYNVDNDDAFVVVDREGDQDYAAIDGPIVVWQDHRSGDWDIRGRDLDKKDDFTVIARDGDQVKPAISGRNVVWEDQREGANQPNIFYKNLDNGESKRVTDNGDSRDPDISGDWIVYRTGNPNGDNQRVRAYNIKSGESRSLSDRNQLGSGPKISGTLAVWADRRNEEDYNIWGYNLAADTPDVRVLVESKDQTNPDISGNVVVWEDARGSDPRDIRGARLTVPAAATATPTKTSGGSSGGSSGGPAPGPCGFILGFQFLHGNLQGTDGDCVDNEHDDPNGTGDRVQTTTKGYMVWQKATNTMRWTDGYRTFTYSSCGLQPRLNTQTWAWERNPSIVVGGNVPPGGCALS